MGMPNTWYDIDAQDLDLALKPNQRAQCTSTPCAPSRFFTLNYTISCWLLLIAVLGLSFQSLAAAKFPSWAWPLFPATGQSLSFIRLF